MNASDRDALLRSIEARFERNAGRHAGIAWAAVRARLDSATAALQRLGEFNTRTSNWIATPADVRSLGGALLCDGRYGRVFTVHNGAPSYCAVRGLRGLLRV